MANLNVRLLAGDTANHVIEQLRSAIADPSIRFTAGVETRKPLPASSTDTALFKAIEHAVAAMSPGTVVAPYMSTWATDSAQLREKGVQAYGVLWPDTPQEEELFHGNDERIRISSLDFGVHLLWRVLDEVAVRK